MRLMVSGAVDGAHRNEDGCNMVIRPLDVDELRRRFRSAKPFPHIVLDNFLEPGFAEEAALAFPDYSLATELGHSFSAVNENRKVQVSDYARFPDPVKRLSDALGSSQFLRDLEAITGVENLLWDK